MNKPFSVPEIIKHTDIKDLHQFITDYANKNIAFRQAFNAKFNPSGISTGSKKIYTDMVSAAFKNNPFTVRGRYHNWSDYGFDAEGVREDLQLLIDKVEWFIQSENFDEAIRVCQAMIETIPDEWEDQFDREGDVQVMYDGAINQLQEMLEQDALTRIQKEKLFDWYSAEFRNKKHEYVGLNTSLSSLENYFTDTPEMIDKTLSNIDGKINNAASDYEKENAILSKIAVLQKTNQQDKAAAVIDRYIDLKGIRELRLESLMEKKKYGEAVALIEKGIQIAIANSHPGSVRDWQEKLFNIYISQNNTEPALALAEELFYNSNRDKRKYYDYIKKQTQGNAWPRTVERLLSKMDDSHWGFNTFKADILIEHKMWDRLLAVCLKAGAQSLEHYEKYLKPVYPKELFAAFHKYVEQQATFTDKSAYINVARVLKKMKHYKGGKEVVASLLNKYREIYKRRRKMMEELEGV
ncbi:MAG: hypothetical protein IT250_13250 [Chitinophagaceae bacterium]|nr:hypothetical protein [Chitinophagaceae bacterium]